MTAENKIKRYADQLLKIIQEKKKDSEKPIAIISSGLGPADPDFLCGAYAIAKFLEEYCDYEVDIVSKASAYPQNKLIVNKFNISLTSVKAAQEKKYNLKIIFDSSESELIPEPDVVIDHHEIREDLLFDEDCLAIRFRCGACSSIVAELLKSIIRNKKIHFVIDEDIASALYTAIAIETKHTNSSGSSKKIDDQAYRYVFDRRDKERVAEILNLQSTGLEKEKLKQAFRLERRIEEEQILVSGIIFFPEELDKLDSDVITAHICEHMTTYKDTAIAIILTLVLDKDGFLKKKYSTRKGPEANEINVNELMAKFHGGGRSDAAAALHDLGSGWRGALQIARETGEIDQFVKWHIEDCARKIKAREEAELPQNNNH